MEFLDRIRKSEKKVPLSKAVIHTVHILCAGLAIGFVIKLLDLYTVWLGDLFSQTSVWFFLCTLIAVHSATAKRAAVNVFCFCAGMLLTYYITAELTQSSYSLTFVYGWAIFSLFSPLMGFCVWYAKGKSPISKLLSATVILVMLAAAFVLFDKIRIADLIFAVFTGVVLFWPMKPKRSKA